MILVGLMLNNSVHPHVRGEQIACFLFNMASSGSSPRTWGTVPPSTAIPAKSRFIPTYVGNSRARAWERTKYCGSSPRTWGTAPSQYLAAHEPRFIPTYVGNSRSNGSFVIYWPVHPHVRGEQRREYRAACMARGSSPRTWGTVPQRQSFMPHSAVHPHVRGEQFIADGCYVREIGSSPRTWGTDLASAVLVVRIRFIPTYVGNS